MAKNVDGIKKLSPEELEKSRQIVLDSIGEGKKQAPAASVPLKPPAGPRTVDSVLFKKAGKILNPSKSKSEKDLATNFLSLAKDDIRPPAPARPASGIDPFRVFGAGKGSTAEKSRLEEKQKAAARQRAEAEARERARQAEADKKRQEEARIKQEEEQKAAARQRAEAEARERARQAEADKKRQEEERIKQEEARKRSVAEKERLEEEQKAAARQRAEAEARERARQAEEKKAKRRARREKLRGLKDGFKLSLSAAVKAFNNSIRIVFLISFLGLLIGFMLYSALLIVIIEYRLDGKYLRFASNYLPIPAYISRDGIVGFYQYIDIKKELARELDDPGLIEQAAKTRVVENILIAKLLNRYGVNAAGAAGSDEIKNVLSDLIMKDGSINQVGLTRINKIKDLVAEDGDFVKTVNKYGDAQNKVTLSLDVLDAGEDLFGHADSLKELEVDGVSEVLSSRNGYYLYRCFDRRNNNLYLSYVYVKGKSLDEYIREETVKYKLWSLVD